MIEFAKMSILLAFGLSSLLAWSMAGMVLIRCFAEVVRDSWKLVRYYLGRES